MNGRRLFRNYAKLKGKEAIEFVSLSHEWYDHDILTTKDKLGRFEKTTIDYKEIVFLLIRNKLERDTK